jgi:hypothetical protein
MALLSRNKPTKRIEFEGGWVELQYLSKGVKDQIQSSLAGLYKELETINVSDLKNEENIPKDIEMDKILQKINEIEYYKLSKAIKAWSEHDVEITVETVKELDDEVFSKISDEINKMNSLNEVERKN